MERLVWFCFVLVSSDSWCFALLVGVLLTPSVLVAWCRRSAVVNRRTSAFVRFFASSGARGGGSRCSYGIP